MGLALFTCGNICARIVHGHVQRIFPGPPKLNLLLKRLPLFNPTKPPSIPPNWRASKNRRSQWIRPHRSRQTRCPSRRACPSSQPAPTAAQAQHQSTVALRTVRRSCRRRLRPSAPIPHCDTRIAEPTRTCLLQHLRACSRISRSRTPAKRANASRSCSTRRGYGIPRSSTRLPRNTRRRKRSTKWR